MCAVKHTMLGTNFVIAIIIGDDATTSNATARHKFRNHSEMEETQILRQRIHSGTKDL